MGIELSVIIPVYNSENYISHCLDSILNQSLKNIEVIVVDDGSTDRTSYYVQQYTNSTKNVHLLKQKNNVGTGHARNIGIMNAKGTYIAFLDADDWLDMDGYLAMTTSLNTSGADIAICDIYTEYGDYRRSEIRYQYKHKNVITGKFALRLLCKTEAYDHYISPRVGNKVFRKDFIRNNDIRFVSYSIWEDDFFTFIALSKANKVALVPSVAEHYFQNESSIMHSFSCKHIDCLISMLGQLRKQLTTSSGILQYEEEYYAFLDRCLNTLFDTIFATVQSVREQKKYINYLIEKLLQLYTIKELIEHIDPKRISRIWI